MNHKLMTPSQVHSMLAAGTLPPILCQVLSNPCIWKVGKNVALDLANLQKACQHPDEFRGAQDLAQLAKSRLQISSAHASLSDICATVLQKCLPKNVSERTSGQWEDEILSMEHIRYAALDVYASLALYHTLESLPYPSPLQLEPPPPLGTTILLSSTSNTNGRYVARGVVVEQPPHFDGINISPSQYLIEVHQVYAPGFKISTHHKQALSEIGPAPFCVVCLKSHVFQFSGDIQSTVLEQSSSSSSEQAQTSSLDQEDFEGDITTGLNDEHGLLSGSSDPDSSSELLGNESLVNLSHYQSDLQALSAAKDDLDALQLKWPKAIRSRVLKDPFHVFNMFYLAAGHGLRNDFCGQLRDAMFIPNPEDKARIVDWASHRSPPLSWEYLLLSKPAWVLSRVRQTIPPPEQLYDLVKKVFYTYGPLKDAKTNQPLFNAEAWRVAKNILKLVLKGFVSDPPGISLYVALGSDRYGLTVYRCMRGTNYTEGGVHRHLVKRLPTSGVSIEHMHACLKDFILYHNLCVS